MENYFPIFVNLRDKSCLVVGGGKIALAKVNALLRAGADVTVVAIQVRPELADYGRRGFIEFHQRPYRDADLDGRFLVVAATGEQTLQSQIFARCSERGQLINAADDPANCNFILPAVATAGPVQVAVSTSGTSPGLAGRLRGRIQRTLLGAEVGLLAGFLGEWRGRVRHSLSGYETKRLFWERVLDSRVPDLVAAGDDEAASALVARLLAEFRQASPTNGDFPNSAENAGHLKNDKQGKPIGNLQGEA